MQELSLLGSTKNHINGDQAKYELSPSENLAPAVKSDLNYFENLIYVLRRNMLGLF